MIPTLLLVGMAGALAAVRRVDGRLLAAAGIFASLAWGLGVGSPAGGAVLAAANLLTGFVFGLVARCVLLNAAQVARR